MLDEVTRRNLEIFQSSLSRSRTGSLLHVLDQTVTAMGGRLLRQWLSQPLCVLSPLQARQEAIAELVRGSYARSHLQHMLAGIADLERILGRLSRHGHTSRTHGASDSIAKLPDIETGVCMPKSSSRDPDRTVRLSGRC